MQNILHPVTDMIMGNYRVGAKRLDMNHHASTPT